METSAHGAVWLRIRSTSKSACSTFQSLHSVFSGDSRKIYIKHRDVSNVRVRQYSGKVSCRLEGTHTFLHSDWHYDCIYRIKQTDSLTLLFTHRGLTWPLGGHFLAMPLKWNKIHEMKMFFLFKLNTEWQKTPRWWDNMTFYCGSRVENMAFTPEHEQNYMLSIANG